MNEQIEEMARDINIVDHEYCNGRCIGCEHKPKTIDNCACVDIAIATGLVAKGYRRQDEVAREIFTQLEEEIEAAIKSNYIARTEHLKKYPENYNLEIVSNIHGKINALRGIQSFISILKIEYGVTEDESES